MLSQRRDGNAGIAGGNLVALLMAVVSALETVAISFYFGGMLRQFASQKIRDEKKSDTVVAADNAVFL